MTKHPKPLTGADIDRLSLRVAYGTATPDEARKLIAEFVRQGSAGHIEPRLIAHVGQCFRTFLVGERMLPPSMELRRAGIVLVPISSLDKAFGLTCPSRGRPNVDRDTLCAVAKDVLVKMLAGDTLEVAAEAVATDRRDVERYSFHDSSRAAVLGRGYTEAEMIEFLRLPSVLKARGKRRSSHYSDIAHGLFTKQVRIGINSVAWPAHEVHALNAARLAGKSDDEIRTLVRGLEAARESLEA